MYKYSSLNRSEQTDSIAFTCILEWIIGNRKKCNHSLLYACLLILYMYNIYTLQ